MTMIHMGNRMNWLRLVTILHLIAIPLWSAESSVTGQVIDEAGAPISKAILKLTSGVPKRGPVVVESDMNGRFSFVNIRAGNHQMVIEAPGFKSRMMSIHLKKTIQSENLGVIRLTLSCSGPGTICDMVEPKDK